VKEDAGVGRGGGNKAPFRQTGVREQSKREPGAPTEEKTVMPSDFPKMEGRRKTEGKGVGRGGKNNLNKKKKHCPRRKAGKSNFTVERLGAYTRLLHQPGE